MRASLAAVAGCNGVECGGRGVRRDAGAYGGKRIGECASRFGDARRRCATLGGAAASGNFVCHEKIKNCSLPS